MDFRAWDTGDYKQRITGEPTDTVYQIVISLIAGLSAFVAFCVRPLFPLVACACD